MSRSTWITLGLVALLAISAGTLWLLSRDDASSGGGVPGAGTPTATSAEPETVTLYFPGASGLLPERREVSAATLDERVAAIVEALLAGPTQSTLSPLVPADVRLGAAMVQDGTAFVDLQTAEGEQPPSFGSRRELLAVYSIVDTLVLSSDAVDRVELSWNGRQRTTFAGHVDTSRPIEADLDYLAER